MNYNTKETTNIRLCSECKGKCCKQAPCFLMPCDFEEITYKHLKRIIKESKSITIAISKNQKDKKFYFLRIRRKNEKICDNLKEGECILLSDKGCILSYSDRPSSGKALIPSKYGCISLYTIDDIIKAWMPYQYLLKFLYCILKKEG